jgi:hypothetical protein
LSKLPPIAEVALFVFATVIPVFFVQWFFIQSRKKVVIIPQLLPEGGVTIPLFSAYLRGPWGNSRFFMRPSSPSRPELLLFERDFQVSSYIKFTGTKQMSYQEIESAEISKKFFSVGSQWAIHLQLKDRKNSYSIWMNEQNAKNVAEFLSKKISPC